MVDGSYIPGICVIEALKNYMRRCQYPSYEGTSKYPKYYPHTAVFHGSLYGGILDGLRVANNIDEKLYVGYLQMTGERYTNYHSGYEDLYEKIVAVLIDIGFLKPVPNPYNPAHPGGFYSIN